jgi:phage baseplate assembly protein W
MPIQTAGLVFPFTLTTGKHTVVSGVDLITASIKTIIAWPLFTKFCDGTFGSRFYEALEEPNDDILLDLIRRFVIDAIGKWEKRIELTNVTIGRPSPEKITVYLTYNIKESNIEGSFYYNYPLNY